MTFRLASLAWFFVGAAVLAAVVLAPSARATEGFAGCTHRSAAHQAEHGGLKADSAWHVAHGDLPTCEPEKKLSPAETRQNEGGGKDRGGKSRYCRTHWFC